MLLNVRFITPLDTSIMRWLHYEKINIFEKSLGICVRCKINLCCSLNILGTIWTSKFRAKSVNGWVLWYTLWNQLHTKDLWAMTNWIALSKKRKQFLEKFLANRSSHQNYCNGHPLGTILLFVWHINCKKVFLIYSAKIYPWYHHSNTPCDWFS